MPRRNWISCFASQRDRFRRRLASRAMDGLGSSIPNDADSEFPLDNSIGRVAGRQMEAPFRFLLGLITAPLRGAGRSGADTQHFMLGYCRSLPTGVSGGLWSERRLWE